LRILLLTRYTARGASSRVRFYQYLPALERHGIQTTIAPLLPDAYLASLYDGRRQNPLPLLAAFGSRVAAARRGRNFDLVWIESEALPWLPAFLERLALPHSVPTVVDFDDAIFHRYDQHPRAVVRAVLGRKVDLGMRQATLVLAGNEYIAARARQAGAKRVEVLPSAVDTELLRPTSPPDRPGVRVGWIGTPLTAAFLEPLRDVLGRVAARLPMEVVLIGARPGMFEDLGATVLPWRQDSEVDDLNRFDVGIMPVPDRPFERGKCGYKILQYMACGRAVIASPVGVNTQIVEHGVNGLLASSDRDWEEALLRLGSEPQTRVSFGLAGRRTVVDGYSTAVVIPRLVRLLEEVASG
jgi:glycosyltransferase involved in cell wall biosynthesis